jgi:hypothetical protein
LFLIAAGVVAVAATAGVLVAGGTQKVATPVLLKSAPPDRPQALALRGAIAVAQPVIQGWGSGWAVRAVRSSDVNDTPTASSGNDGRRVTWQFETTGPTGQERWLRVTGGTVVDAIVAAESPKGASPVKGLLPDKIIDSTTALDTVRGAYPAFAGAAPGAEMGGKATGTHFSLEADPSTGGAVLAVLGRIGSDTVRISVDATSGKVILSEKRTLSASLFASLDGGLTWQEQKVPDGIPLRVASGPAGGDEMFVVEVHGGRLVLAEWLPSRAAWRTLATFPPEAGTRAKSIAYVPAGSGNPFVAIAATDGLWSVEPSTGLVRREPVDGAFEVLSDDHGGLDVLANSGAGGTARLSRRADGQWSPATDAGGANRLARIDEKLVPYAQGKPLVPGQPALNRMSGGGATLFAAAMSGELIRSEDGGARWTTLKTDARDIVDVAVPSTDWAGPGLAFAAEFRGSLWRTTDGGATWRPVLALPGQLASVAFVRQSFAALTVVGGFTWTAF